MSDPLGKLDDLISVLKGERDERRRHKRVKALKRTRIHFGEPSETMRCFVADLSATGARLRPADAPKLPDNFDLELEHDLFLRCVVQFRADDELGVSFEIPAKSA